MPHASGLTFSRLQYEDNFQLAALVQEGIPARSMPDLAGALSLTLAQLAKAAHISKRTLERRVATNTRLKSDESERALRLGRLYAIALDVFEDNHAAAEWLGEPLKALGGKSPLQLCATEPGAREVERTLGRIEHGVFS